MQIMLASLMLEIKMSTRKYVDKKPPVWFYNIANNLETLILKRLVIFYETFLYDCDKQ